MREAGRRAVAMLKEDFRPSRVLKRENFENAIAAVMATGGSTNAVLHLLACAREAGTDLALDDFDAISARTPLLADMKPWGRFTAVDMDKAGGIMRRDAAPPRGRPAEEGRDDGHRPHASARRRAPRRRRRARRSCAPLDNPIAKSGGMVILKGSLAPEGGVMKVAGHLMEARRVHRARVRPRGGRVRRGRRREDQGRRLRRHPLRGAEGRAGDARDARRHRRDRRRGSRGEGLAHHRRTFLRRDARSRRRTHRARGRGRRSDRGDPRRRHDPHRSSEAARSTSTSRRTRCAAGSRQRKRPRRAMRRGRSRSTRSSFRPASVGAVTSE